jgi:hypothetical protein
MSDREGTTSDPETEEDTASGGAPEEPGPPETTDPDGTPKENPAG